MKKENTILPLKGTVKLNEKGLIHRDGQERMQKHSETYSENVPNPGFSTNINTLLCFDPEADHKLLGATKKVYEDGGTVLTLLIVNWYGTIVERAAEFFTVNFEPDA